MPRLTAKQYIASCRHTHRFYRVNPHIFSELSLRDQCAIHDYFRPSQSHPLDILEALDYRAAITAQQPSLPQRAGRAFTKLWNAYYNNLARRVGHVAHVPPPEPPAKRTRATPQHARNILVTSVLKPTPDSHQLGRSFVGLLEELARQGRQIEDLKREARGEP